jgi:hypothetical protein
MGSHPVAGSPLKRGIQPKRNQHIHLVLCQNDASRKHLRQSSSTSGSAGGGGAAGGSGPGGGGAGGSGSGGSGAGGSGSGGCGCQLDKDFKVRNLKI